MKKRFLSALLAAAMMLTMMPAAFAADDESQSSTVQTEVVLPDITEADFGDNTVFDGETYYKTMMDALTGIHKTGKHTLWCNPGKNVGSMTHGHVCANLTVYGNGAYISGGERDFELEQYIKPNSSQDGTDWSGDVTLKVYNLNGAAVWGTRRSAYTLNIYMENCENMNRVYLNGTTGANNITLKNCTFDGTLENPQKANNCTVYSNAGGIVDLQNCTFTGVSEPINMNTKAGASKKTINVTGCTFTDCGLGNNKPDPDSDIQWAAPIRVVNSGTKICETNVKDCTFKYSEGKTSCNGDILIGDGRQDGKFNDVTLNVSGTAANIQMQKPGYYPTKDASKLNQISVDTSETLKAGLAESFAVAQVGGKSFDTLDAALAEASKETPVVLLKDITVSNTIQIEKSISINGNGKSITRTTNGMVINVLYQDGIDVAITNLTLKGNNPGGLLEWTMQEIYKENAAPAVTPKLTIEKCTFSSGNGQKTGAGIGLWGHKPGDWFNAAKSEVVIDNCVFDTLSVGIYYNEEDPLLNLRSTVTNNEFRNLSWTGIAGIPTNAEIAYNTFESSCQGAVQYLLNAKQMKTNTSIHDNVIDSAVGIEFMPYHLNEGNQNGGNATVAVTKDMLPSIKKNIRNTDTNLVKVVAYRAGSDETLKLAENTAIDLTENYTKGVAPTIETVVQTATGGNTAPTVEDAMPEIKNDVYYEEDTMNPEDLNTYHPSSGGSSSSTYAITVDKMENGAVSASAKYASRGRTVTLTVSPDKGYELDELTVTDKNGKEVKLTDKGNGKFTFEMPASKITVQAVFVKADVKPEPVSGFEDVKTTDWFAEEVAYVVDKGMMNGITKTTFAPNATTTRGMIVTILHRLEKEPAAAEAAFTDVADGKYYSAAIDWAAANGIVKGVSETKFAPDTVITREQMAAILYRYAQYKGYDVSKTAKLDEYKDGVEVSAYATNAMQWANAEGLITGKTSVTLVPKGSATRAEVATILMRFCENIVK
ncbi:MAG: S-layer homology domain-containing protein [Agathobaculum sp.]|jgi:hypothetical protein|uniref:S-layer homology domain-containing protein n=2 Tax=Agathobaculum sp. TaxID=2048138 RepID=UPI003D8A692B